MSNYQQYLSDEQLERLLEKSAAAVEQPPVEVVQDVTPWRRAMERIIVGTALNLLTLNFLLLNYILPVIGLTMLLLGFRALRRENGWCKVAYLLSIYRCCFAVFTLIGNATVYRLPETVTGLLAQGNFAAQLLVYVCLWRALIAVQKKAGVEVGAPGAGGLIIWNVVLLGLAMVRYSGWLVLIGLVVVYIILLRTLAETAKTLDEAGYDVTIAPVRVPDAWISGAIAFALAAGILLGHFFGTGYRMDWQLRDETTTAETTAIKDELLALGYPDHALADLSTEDLLACRGAKNIVADTDSEWDDHERVTGTMRHTGVAVELANSQWRFFHHFHWRKASDGTAPQFYGTEAIQLYPVYQMWEGWSPGGEMGGRVLYDKGDRTYTAPFAYLSADTYTANSFFGSSTRTDIFAGFSLPRSFRNQRGYITYDAVNLNKGYIIDSWFNYTHQTASFLYPARTAMDYGKNSMWGRGDQFSIIYTALQASPDENGIFHPW